MANDRYTSTSTPLFSLAEDRLTLAGRPIQLYEARPVLLRLMRALCNMDFDTLRQAGWRLILDHADNGRADAAIDELRRSARENSWCHGSIDDALRSLFNAVQKTWNLHETAVESVVFTEDDLACELARMRGLQKDSPKVTALIYEMAAVPMPPAPAPKPAPAPQITAAQKERLRLMPEEDRACLAWLCAEAATAAWPDGPVKSASASLGEAILAYVRGGRSHAERALLGPAITAFDRTKQRAERAGLWPNDVAKDVTDAVWWAAESLDGPEPWMSERALLLAAGAVVRSEENRKRRAPYTVEGAVDMILAKLSIPDPEEVPVTKPVPELSAAQTFHTDIVDELLADMMRGNAVDVFANYVTDTPDRPTLDMLVVGGVRILRMFDVPGELRRVLEETEALIAAPGKPEPIDRPIAPGDESPMANVVRLARACAVPYRTSQPRASAVLRFMRALTTIALGTEPSVVTMALIGAGCPLSADVREAIARSVASAPLPESVSTSVFADRVGEAAIRVAATQTLRVVRAPMVGILLRPMGLADDARRTAAGMLEAPGGEALVSALLSFVPGVVAPDSALGERVAQEFRVRTLVCLGEPLFDAITAPLGELFESVVWGDEELAPTPASSPDVASPAPLPPLSVPPVAQRERVAASPAQRPAAKPAPRRGRA